jgi:type IV pilus biogenesis/stability protein PilW
MEMTERAIRAGLGAAVLAALLAPGCGGKAPATKPGPKMDNQQRVRLADSYARAGKMPEALETLEEAVALDPSNASLHNYHGQYLFLAGRFGAAEEAFRKALSLDPYLTDARNNLGAVLDRVGKKDDAVVEFRKALEDPAYPTPQKVWLNLGMTYASQGRSEEAISAMRQAVEIDPKFYRAHYELASELDKTGRVDEAVRLYEVAAPEFRSDPTYHYRLGVIYVKVNNRDKAKIHLNRVLELSPGSENAVKAADLLKVLG